LSEDQLSDVLVGWEGYGVKGIERAGEEVRIELVAEEGRVGLCSGCGQAADEVHEVVQRWVRDLPILGSQTWLRVHRRRLRCPRCGPKLEQLGWLERYARVTRRLADSVARLCAVLPVKHAASFFGLDWHTVKAIDQVALRRQLGPVDLSGVELVLLDEFALHKGHRYATVAVDARSKRVLWVGRGRTRAELRPFFELLGPEGCVRIKAFGMDMTAAYEQEIRLHCPQAEIVYDLFHVVAKYGREVIDRVRVDEANRLRQDPRQRRVVKTARWLLLRNRDHLTRPEDQVRLQELLAANQHLLTVYLLKEDLKQLWRYRHPGYARRFWHAWLKRARSSAIPALLRFAQRLLPYVPGILAHCRWPLHTSLLEGINNRIKVIKRMAYGFRDEEYFFLKIRAAFPGGPTPVRWTVYGALQESWWVVS
jgi:transposase